MKRVSTALKIVISAAILIFLFRSVDFAQGAEYLKQIRPSYLLFSVILIVAGQLVRAHRLAVMVFGGAGIRNFRHVLRIQMVSFLPGVVSPAKVGEVTKIFMLQSELGVPTERGLVCFVTERVLDLLLLSPLAGIGLYVFYRAGLHLQLRTGWMGGVAVALALFAAALFAGLLFARSRGISFRDVWRTSSPNGLAKAGALTIIYWLIVFAEVWCFCKATAFDARILHMALVVPPALLSSMIPVTLSGFGIRELAMTVLLQRPPLGAGYEQALMVSLMYGIIGLGVPALMGVLFWVAGKRDGAAQA